MSAAMWNLARTRLGPLTRSMPFLRRPVCSQAEPASPLAALRNHVTRKWDEIIESEWVDTPELATLTEDIDEIVAAYRPLYDEGAVATPGEEKDTYEDVKKLYIAGETAKLVELYQDHMEFLLREHMEMTGFLGNDTDVKPEDQKRIADSIHEYANFINAIENNRVRRKAESQLGRKAIQLRQVLSVDQFSVDFYPVACDQLVIPRKTTKSQPDPQ